MLVKRVMVQMARAWAHGDRVVEAVGRAIPPEAIVGGPVGQLQAERFLAEAGKGMNIGRKGIDMLDAARTRAKA